MAMINIIVLVVGGMLSDGGYFLSESYEIALSVLFIQSAID